MRLRLIRTVSRYASVLDQFMDRAWILGALLVALVFAIQVAPYFDDEVGGVILQNDEVRRTAVDLSNEYQSMERRYVTVPLSTLVVAGAYIQRLAPDLHVTVTPDRPRFRVDRLIVAAGLAIVLIGSFVFQSISSLKPDISAARLRQIAASDNGERSAAELFSLDVESAAHRADMLFSRATLVLLGGVAMSFIGVATFYVTLPEASATDTMEKFWPRVVRPTGVLIFIESIAWFLLRQYRALIEDYKWFHKIYLKRANYLAAIRLMADAQRRPEDSLVALSLIGEDFSGKLAQGETTEALEAMKQDEVKPISSLIDLLSALRMQKKAE